MIEAWVTDPAGNILAVLDRSVSSPFRGFAFDLIRNQPGAGSLEYHLDNRLVTDTPGLLDMGNIVWMKYRGRTRAWIIEDERTVLDQNEHATDWRQLSGRGTLQLLADRLVYPTDFASGANLDPSTWTSQWRSFINRAAGEMLWDLIDESNARFVTQITRAADFDASTGSDDWTQDLRFENVLNDVISSVTAVHGDVEMNGLAFSYYTAQGQDLTAEVIFEEGADLLSLTHDRTDRDRVSYVIGEGVGEGVFAKLAIASRADARRIEGFLAAKDATNVPLLQNLTDAALTQNDRRETVSFEVDESRYRVFTDFDLGDTVRAIAPSRSVDTMQRIDAIYLAEDGDRVRVALDLNGLRDDELLKLYGEQSATRSQLGVRNRQPQGQMVPFNFNGTGVFDSDEPAIIDFLISDRIYVTIETEVLFAFSEFWAAARASTSGGGDTSGSGGGSAPTTSSGGSSSPTSAGSAHSHRWGTYISDTPISATVRRYATNTLNAGVNIDAQNAVDLLTFNEIPGHTHTVTIGSHDHSVIIAAHDHSTPNHAHGLDYGIFKETLPGSHSVNVGIYQRSGSSWNLIVSLSDLTDDLEELDLSQYIDGPGSWRLEIQSEAAQPNGGRLAVSVSGQVIGAIKSS